MENRDLWLHLQKNAEKLGLESKEIETIGQMVQAFVASADRVITLFDEASDALTDKGIRIIWEDDNGSKSNSETRFRQFLMSVLKNKFLPNGKPIYFHNTMPTSELEFDLDRVTFEMDGTVLVKEDDESIHVYSKVDMGEN